MKSSKVRAYLLLLIADLVDQLYDTMDEVVQNLSQMINDQQSMYGREFDQILTQIKMLADSTSMS